VRDGGRLTLYGTGSWNTSNGNIDARGTFVHRHQDGSLFAEGEWVGHPPSGSVQGVTIPSLGFTQPVQQPHRFTAFLRV
jgi:hypothetical protein